MLLGSCRWHYMGIAPAGWGGALPLYMHGGVSWSRGHSLLLGPGSVGLAVVCNIRILTLIRAQARVQELMGDAGIGVVRDRMHSRPLLLTFCRRTRCVVPTGSGTIPVQYCILTDLTRM